MADFRESRLGHVSPEAWAGGPIGKVREGDKIRLLVDTVNLTGSIDIVGETVEKFKARGHHPDLKQDPRIAADTRLWSALQNASGGSWGGCVYDADRIAELLAKGHAAEG